ncbi:SDR family NAD(P)-dependent oxidoreductase [Mangrovibacterium sp.]|uniref:SDR family NAD(P)-dependent oxidoreductase n=1 Tax=Mangrovibacterium sp. TaxID=1961364 RepID=UPI0035615AB4
MRTAIVTGASKGIGKAIALKLASLSYTLVVVGRSNEQLTAVKNTIEKMGVPCLALALDLRNENTPELIVQETIKKFGRIDLLVNNAGMALSSSISETDMATWNALFEVNARAPFFLCKSAVPALKKSDHPIIINISSVVGFKGYAGQAAYASSKHALAGFTKVLAKEVQSDGIRVHLISPGGVNTEMVQEMRPDINIEELIQTEEIAELVQFLVTRKGNGTIDHFYIRRQSGLAFD